MMSKEKIIAVVKRKISSPIKAGVSVLCTVGDLHHSLLVNSHHRIRTMKIHEENQKAEIAIQRGECAMHD